MKYLKLFENHSVDSILNMVDDISMYLPTHSGEVETKWTLPDFHLNSIVGDDELKKYNRTKPSNKHYLRYYIFGFYELRSFFEAEHDIIHRANIYGLRFFLLSTKNDDRQCKLIFFTKSDYEKLNIEAIKKTFSKSNYDLLFEEDFKIDKNDFEILYDDEEITAIKPKTYRGAIKYGSDTKWGISLKKNMDWFEKFYKRGPYYGGFNWYKDKSVKKEIKTWYDKLFNIFSKKEKREFCQNFPKYLMYFVIIKKLPIDDPMSRLYLLFDPSRDEYGYMNQHYSNDYISGKAYGDMLDASHNNLIIYDVNDRRITLKDIFYKHRFLFNKAFREIEFNYNSEKEELYDIVGFWADDGGQYSKDKLMFVRDDKDELHVTLPEFYDAKNRKFQSIGKYSDKDKDYWNMNKKKIEPKKLNDKRFSQMFNSDYSHLLGSLDDFKT